MFNILKLDKKDRIVLLLTILIISILLFTSLERSYYITIFWSIGVALLGVVFMIFLKDIISIFNKIKDIRLLFVLFLIISVVYTGWLVGSGDEKYDIDGCLDYLNISTEEWMEIRGIDLLHIHIPKFEVPKFNPK